MKKAFTLAEVLITLGIIGVVAAMTIPTLVQRYKEIRTISTLKESQSILSQAIKMATNEYGDPDGWELGYNARENDAKIIADKLRPFIKLALDCGTLDLKGNCCPNKVYKRLNGGNWQTYYDRKEYYKVKLMNGSSVWWRSASNYENNMQDNYQFVIFIDTNGTAQPNTWGRDLFAFNVYNSSLRPIGSPYDNYNGTCKLSSNGIGCAYYVLTQNNMNYLR